MKKIIHSVILTASSCAYAMEAPADVSANIGFASEYYYRGVLQKESSANGGLDYENGGFYLGTWAADVGDGLEIDLYTGYGIETEKGISLSLGVTGYYYTGDTFDDTYEEVNLSAGYGPISIAYSVGTHDNLDGGTDDYDFLEISLEHEGYHATFGTWGDDFDGEYLELGYSTEIGGFGVGIAAIFSSEELSFEVDSDGDATEGEALVFTVSKSFDL